MMEENGGKTSRSGTLASKAEQVVKSPGQPRSWFSRLLGQNQQAENSKPADEDKELPPTIPLPEKTPLSPLLETLCVGAIWLIIVGVPFFVRYQIYILPFWVAAGVFLEDRCRKKHDIFFLGRRATNWLLASWVWEIFVRRCHVGSKNALQLRTLAGVFLAVGGGAFIIWLSFSPPIELKEMRVVTGTLDGWKRQPPGARGGCGDIITLRLEDGRNEKFYKGKATEDFYRQMKGQELTIWVQSNTDGFLPNCRKFYNIKQMQHGGRFIGLPYDKARYEKTQRFAYKTARFVIWTGLFFLLLVWLINRRKNTQVSEVKKS